jgi:hypothetical protein
MSKLILAGHELDGDLPQLKNFREPPYWDASAESVWYPGWYPGANAPIQGAQSPDAKNKGARRYAYRPSLRRYYFGGGKQPPLDAAKASINKFIFHHDGCRDVGDVLAGAAERARPVVPLPDRRRRHDLPDRRTWR